MGKTEFIAFTERGCRLAADLARALEGDAVAGARVSGPVRFAGELGIDAYDSLAAWTAESFAQADALVFVGATGIAVRAIAPHVKDKLTDPAVVAVDEAGLFAVPLLSGHVGGANELARAIARATGGQAVVSTATDVNGCFAVDEWAAQSGLSIMEREIAKRISARLLQGGSVGFATDCDVEGDLPEGVHAGPADLGFVVSLDEGFSPHGETLHLAPRIVTVGVGCRKGADPAVLRDAVDEALAQAGISVRAVATLATIDVKRGEPAIEQLAAERGWELRFHSAEELTAVPGEFASSDFVRQTVGVDNVCERAALAQGGTLIAGKQAGNGVTVALARADWKAMFR